MTSQGYTTLPTRQQQEEIPPPPAYSDVAGHVINDSDAPPATVSHGATIPPPYPDNIGYSPTSAYPIETPPEAAPGTTSSPARAAPSPHAQPMSQTYITDDVDLEEGGFTAELSFSDKKVRQGFIRKVYLILMVQLLVTFGIVCLFVFCKPINEFVVNQPAVYWSSYGVFLVCYIGLACCGDMRRKFPTNIIMLAIFTLALSYMVGTISCFYTTKSVLIALGICAGVCLSVTIFSIQTKYDFTSCGGVIFVLLMSLLWFGFFCIFFYSEILQVVYAGAGAIIFTIILAVDTQLVIGNKRYQISPEEYVFAALNLYVDIVYIFLYILALFGGRN